LVRAATDVASNEGGSQTDQGSVHTMSGTNESPFAPAAPDTPTTRSPRTPVRYAAPTIRGK
jgi:hypothetical protein